MRHLHRIAPALGAICVVATIATAAKDGPTAALAVALSVIVLAQSILASIALDLHARANARTERALELLDQETTR